MLFTPMSCFSVESDGKVSSIIRFLEKSDEYQRKCCRIESQNALEMLHYARQYSKIGLHMDKIQTFLFHEVDMGNIYLCSDVNMSCPRMDIWCLKSIRKCQDEILACLLPIKIGNVG